MNKQLEKTKEHYILNGTAIVRESTLHNTPKYRKEVVDLIINNNKPIGNYFDTREEAEKVVEKLKAWKRLKDSNFRFKCFHLYNRIIDFDVKTYYNFPPEEEQLEKDLHLLFGGEE